MPRLLTALTVAALAPLVASAPAGDPPRPAPVRDGVLVPNGQGDTIAADHRSGEVSRRDAAGNVLWTTPLTGPFGHGREPHLLVDADRAYLSLVGGVAALSARTGEVAWESAGPADRMLLTGRLLVAADCGDTDRVAKGGRWAVARDTATGAEVFKVALPQDMDPYPIEDAAGLVLIQEYGCLGRKELSLLIDRRGKPHHRFDRPVVSARLWRGGDRLVLTSRDVVRLSAGGEVKWTAGFGHEEGLPGGGLVPLPGGHVVAFLYGRISDSGVQLVRLDPEAGRRSWGASCKPLDVDHSKYRHEAVVDVVGGTVRVTSKGSLGTFVEVIDARDGKQVSRELKGR
jgi:outer membrane protein assembly factor BamB